MRNTKAAEKKSFSFKNLPWKQILAVMILFLAFVFFRSERKEMSQILPALRSAEPGWILAGVLVTFVFVLFQALMYITSFRSIGLKIGIWDAVELFLKRNFLSIFLPAGGISSMAYTPAQLRKKNFTPAQIHQASAIYMFVGLLSLFLVGIPVILYSTLHGGKTGNSWTAVVALGAVLGLLFYIVKAFRTKDKLYRFVAKKFPSAIAQADEMFAGDFERKYFFECLAVSTALEFCGILHAFIAMYALGLHPSFEAAAIGYTVSVLLMIVSPFLRGLGAVELSMVYVFADYGYSHSQGLAITLLYRIFEFWLPVFFGILAFFWRGRFFAARIVPAIAIFILGLVNIISVITPPLAERLRLEKLYLPYEAMHFSKLAVLVVGIALLITAAYLIKGLKSAWYFAVAFSLLSLFGNIFKALDYEEATVALVTLILLILSRKQYRLKASPQYLRQGFSVFFAIVAAVFVFNFLSFYFIDKRHFGMDFTWKQSLYHTFRSFLLVHDPVLVPKSRFANDFLGITEFLAFFSWGVLLFTIFRTSKFSHSGLKDYGRASGLLQKYGSSSIDYFKISRDKKLYFSANTEGFVSYNVANHFAVVLEEPVCAKSSKSKIIAEFEAFCKKKGLKSAYYRVDETSLEFFENTGKHKLLIGQEAIVDLEKFSLQGKERKSLRNGLNGLQKKGFKAEFLQAPQSDDVLRQLRKVSDEWLRVYDKEEIVFAEGKFDEEIVKNQDVVVIKDAEGAIVTFLNIIPDFAPQELTYDMVRRSQNAVGGSMDGALVKLMEIGKARNLKYLNMGLTPLAGIGKPDNIAESILRFAYHRLGNFRQYQTMRNFKEKYADFWKNKYLVYGNEVELMQLPAALNKIMKPAEDADDEMVAP